MSKKSFVQYGQLLCGAALFSLAVNLFIEPCSLNTGGLIGLSQLVSFLLFHDNRLTGLINFCFNIPLMMLAWKKISRKFLIKTVVGVAFQSFLLTAIPVPSSPIMPDVLSNVLLAAIIGGVGIGLGLLSSGSLGGLDILGVYFSKKAPDFSVAKLSYAVNLAVLGCSAIVFDLATALYSLILIGIMYFVSDRVHFQNINVYAIIITQNPEVRKMILEKTGRGVTYWMGRGAFTDHETEILLCIMNRYEVHTIKKLVHKADPKAFFLLTKGNPVLGNFEKRLIV